MYIFNISFVIPTSRKQSFLNWANTGGRAAAACESMRCFRIMEVAAIPGDPDFTAQNDRNISIQLSFDSLSDCRRWNECHFPAVMQSYASWHGPDPVFFATILKEL